MSLHEVFKEKRPVAFFTYAYLLGAFIYTLKLGNWEFQLYVIIVFLLVLYVAWLHAFTRFSAATLWMVSLIGLLHLLGGLVHLPQSWPIVGTRHVLYNLWLIPGILKYDNIIHFYGYAVCTWVIWQVLRAMVPCRATWLPVFIAALAANGMGACNEVIEFFAWNVLTETNIGGYTDTGWDLNCNLLGTMVAAFFICHGRSLAKRR